MSGLSAYLEPTLPYDWQIVIADNASIDRTPEVGADLAAADDRVEYLRLEQKGRGRALRRAWLDSDADVVSYMDVDLSTNLDAFLPLVQSIAGVAFDVADRDPADAWRRTHPPVEARVVSRGYNVLIKVMFPRRRLLRRAVRLQGCQPARRGRAGSDGREQRVVLRQRAAAAGPSSAATVSTRCPSSGSRTSTAAST